LLWVPFAQTTSRTTDSGESSIQYQFDSKAMRKVEQGYELAFIVENSDGAHGLDIAVGISLLAGRS